VKLCFVGTRESDLGNPLGFDFVLAVTALRQWLGAAAAAQSPSFDLRPVQSQSCRKKAMLTAGPSSVEVSFLLGGFTTGERL